MNKKIKTILRLLREERALACLPVKRRGAGWFYTKKAPPLDHHLQLFTLSDILISL